MKKSSLCLCALTLATAAQALNVSNVSVRQRWPWNNLVDIDFTLSGTEVDAFYQVDVAARFPGIEGDEVAAKSLVTEPVVSGDGAHRVTWDLAADHPGLVTSNFTARVTVTPLGDTAPVYMVIDLSAGPTAAAGDYKVRYTTQAPDLSDDTCRTTEMWLRRCPAGTFNMGTDNYLSEDTGAWKTHSVTLSHPFYIGIFECTQQQWYQVMGTWPSYYANTDYRATRPVERISFQNLIRGNTGWTDSNRNDQGVGSGTFIAKMRARSGITWLDVPTEAQWEYAARAGTDYRFGWADATESNIISFGRGRNTPGPDGNSVYRADQTVTTDYGTAKVGSYRPNSWGIYDMLGNVSELCGDAGAQSRYYATAEGYSNDNFIDPRWDPGVSGITGGRIRRGGDIYAQNAALSVYARKAYRVDGAAENIGFRVVVTMK